MTSLTPMDRWGDQPADFNRAAADAVFGALVGMDDEEALVVGRLLVADAVRWESVAKRAEIAEAFNADVAARADKLRDALARSAVAKARAGEDNTVELAAMVELAKAYDAHETRDSRGRWAESHLTIGYDESLKPLHPKHAESLGIHGGEALKAKDQSRFQQAYAQIAHMVAPYQHAGGTEGPTRALLHVNVQTAKGGHDTRVYAIPAQGPISIPVTGKEKITSAMVTTSPTPSAGGAAFDAVSAAGGSPRAAAAAAGAVHGGIFSPDRLGAYRDQIDTVDTQDEYIPSQRVFRNLQRGSALLSDSLGSAAPRKLQYALQVGEHVGRLGPQAQRIVGPTADRAAYRYRGIETPVDPVLGSVLAELKRSDRVGQSRQGIRTPEQKRAYMLEGTVNPDTGNWFSSNVHTFFRKQLPSVDLATLQVKSGHVPPSQGVIFDKNSNVAHSAVGYADDHYLPFTPKMLKALKGGDYIRTRTFGGPTTEDIYTGLVSGARSMTVVSHNGVYHVEFKDDLRGGRRFNDKAARMVARYGQLLDAVQSEQVTTGGMDPYILGEIEDKARDKDPTEGPEYDAEVKRLKKEHFKRPQLSQQRQMEIALETLEDAAQREGHAVGRKNATPEDLIADARDRGWERQYQRYTKAGYAAAGANARQFVPESWEQFRQERAANSATTPLGAATEALHELGAEADFKARVERATKDYHDSLQPLKLNGRGYAVALQALHEQFPAYIEEPVFHEWRDAKVSPGREDSGYVRPRHNRPKDALSGYFDPLVPRSPYGGGPHEPIKGKVYADSTRWQNRNRSVRRYQGDGRDSATINGSRSNPNAPVAPKQAVAATAPADPQQLRVKATKDMVDALRSARIRADAPEQALLDAGISPAARGKTLGGLAIGLKDLPQRFPELAQVNDQAFDTLLKEEPDRAYEIAEQARKHAAALHFDLPPRVVRVFDNGGRPLPSKKLGVHPSDDVDELGEDFDAEQLGSRNYDKDVNPSMKQVGYTYQTDPHIQALVKRNMLPAELGSGDFPAAAKQVQQIVKHTRRQFQQAQNDGANIPADRWTALDSDALGLIKAAQLRRRYEQAERRAQAEEQTRAAAAEEARRRAQPEVHEHKTVTVIDGGTGEVQYLGEQKNNGAITSTRKEGFELETESPWAQAVQRIIAEEEQNRRRLQGSQ